jgi:hypothetical protein
MSTKQPQRQTTGDPVAWRAYWAAVDMPWRTEPEIDEKRQRYLGLRREVAPNIEHGIYPFRDENGSIKLTRADVEWLLATHESGGMRGPVDWSDEKQRERDGLELRGAELRTVNLARLPLTQLLGGLGRGDRANTTPQQRTMAGVNLEGADLSNTHLERANLGWARLEGANFYQAHLEESYLASAHLEAANLTQAHLAGASLRNAFLSAATFFKGLGLHDQVHGTTKLGGVHWGEANTSVIDWATVQRLGEEEEAQQRKFTDGKIKSKEDRLQDHQKAAEAYRQLASVLRRQGLHEEASRFAYRAQVLQRQLFRRQRQWLRYVSYLFLELISGYGYQPPRSVATYLLVVLGFAVTYYALGNQVNPALNPLGAIVFSITSFHGRGFAPAEHVLITNSLTVLAAAEAIVGLLIEIVFIATFTNRFFAR